MKYRTILLFGAPGSGKGTQGKILGTIPHFFHCACGDVFRNLKPETPLGQVFVKYSAEGKLVPDDFTVQLWRESIEASTRANQFQPKVDYLVLDGIPRNANQARILAETLEVKAMFWLRAREVSNLISRLQRRALKDNRLDDANIDVIRHRLETYEKETRPVVDFYGKKLVRQIDADKTPLEVCHSILGHIKRLGLLPSV
ncbi:MAG: nucleoside monophosphate kinase [Verrucomicrobia bacterium]|jgi:adenylate kinase|nr:nucleoside monophosphate kinase [Verrucomicrobiota bacterium]